MGRIILFAVCLVALWAFTIGYWAGHPTELYRPVPACQEDAVLIGRGDFEAAAEPGAGGRWSAYVCGPAVDDFQEVTLWLSSN